MLGVYVHIPFCKQKCLYCDFNSRDDAQHLEQQYVAALLDEIRSSTHTQPVDSVFFGGGTPTALQLDALLSIVQCVSEHFALCDAEVTVEVNPATLSQEGFVALQQAGVNRISFGLQSANDDELKTLGRIHTFAQFEQSYLFARDAGFENINVDLMFSLPGQTFFSWEQTLKKVVALRPEHISCYSLMIEPGTPFGQMDLQLPSEEEDRRNFDYAVSYLTGCGFEHYEISNFAKPGFACRQNLKYWTRKEYAGFGAGACSLIRSVRKSNTRDVAQYIKHNQPVLDVLDWQDCINETIMLGLRMTEGINLARFKARFGFDFAVHFEQTISRYRKLGLMEIGRTHCYLTLSGMSVSNRIMADFME